MDRKPSSNTPSSINKPLKTLFILSGEDSVKKTETCESLKATLPNSVYLNGKWCWNADPMVDNSETRYMVLQNICFLLNQFLVCPVYDNIIFGWVFDQKHTIESILGSLDKQDCTIHLIHLNEKPSLQAALPSAKPVSGQPAPKPDPAKTGDGMVSGAASGSEPLFDPDIVEVTTIDVQALEVSQIVEQILAAIKQGTKSQKAKNG